MTYGLDTSVALRILTGRPQPVAGKVEDRIAELRDAGGAFFMCDASIVEAYHALQHFYGMTKEESVLALRALMNEPGFSFSPEATAALDTPEAWKANPGLVDRMIANGYTARGQITLSCEKSFRKLDLVEIIS